MNKKDQEKILVICAHPDDETLGLGGTLKNHSDKGDEINIMFFADGQFGRDSSKKGIERRQNQGRAAGKILGIKEMHFLNYKDQYLETISLVDLSTKMESVINKIKPNIVYTHFWGDVNQDHRRLFDATIIATRPKPDSLVKKLIVYETPSSTDWGSWHNVFQPNLFVDVSTYLNYKIKALKKYSKEVEEFPHPRSIKSVINRTKYWGSKAGLENAEAFMIIRQIE